MFLLLSVCSSNFDVKLYNAGKFAIERIDFSCSSSLEQGRLLLLLLLVIVDYSDKY